MLTWIRLGSLNIALIMANSEDYAVVKTVPSTDELEMIDHQVFLASLLATLWMPSISNNVELWKKMQKFGPVQKTVYTSP